MRSYWTYNPACFRQWSLTTIRIDLIQYILVWKYQIQNTCCYIGNGSISCYINFGLAVLITRGVTDAITLLYLLPPYYIPAILGISLVVWKVIKNTRFQCFDLRWLSVSYSTLNLESKMACLIFVAISFGCSTKLTGLYMVLSWLCLSPFFPWKYWRTAARIQHIIKFETISD